MTRCRVTWQEYVGNSQHFKRLGGVGTTNISRLPPPYSWLPSPISHLPSPVSRLLSPISCLLSPVSCLPPFISHLPSLFYRLSCLPSSSPNPPSPLSPWNTNSRGRGYVTLTAIWRGGWWPPEGEGLIWPPVGMEDDPWVGKGEFDHHKRWGMTAGWGRVNLTASSLVWFFERKKFTHVKLY